MTHGSRAAALAVAALLLAGPAAAQDPQQVVSLVPAELARWDVAGYVGWLGSEKDVGARWDRWFNVVAGGVSAGRYLTPHLKADLQLAAAREGRVYGEEHITLPGEPFLQFRSVQHEFQATTIGAGVSYQFFENQWFHPFAGGGVEVLRERHRVVRPELMLPRRDPGAPFTILPESTEETEVTYAARPFVSAGFKWYVTGRGFIRTDVRTSFSTRGATHVAWTAGIGVDL
jgi:opacity protein-like surface antigen